MFDSISLVINIMNLINLPKRKSRKRSIPDQLKKILGLKRYKMAGYNGQYTCLSDINPRPISKQCPKLCFLFNCRGYGTSVRPQTQ